MTNEKKKILLVDDEEIHLEISRNMLEDLYEITTCKSGKGAIEHLLKGNVPSLILLDILMPNMDGWETFNRLRSISFLKDVPIAFFTSLQEEEQEKHAYLIGASDFIKKPCHQEDLVQRIEAIIEKQQKRHA